jgi:hypothetical protein
VLEQLLDVAATSWAFHAWWFGVVRAQAMVALQAMGFKAEECGVALDAADGSVELACELLVEAA